MLADPALHLTVAPEALRPLVRDVVAEVVRQLDEAKASLPEKLAFSEAEAARLLSLNVHQLRDERLRGRIAASQVVGKRIRYTRQDLLDYLMRERTAPAG
jgi:hypothetical protein